MAGVATAGAERFKLVAAFAAIYIVWGSTYLAIKVAVESIPPCTAAGVRFTMAGLIVYGVMRLRGARAPTAAEWWRIGWLGAMMFVPTYSVMFWAERTIPSGIAAVLVALLPLWTAVLEGRLRKGHPARALLVLALAIGLAGVALVASGMGAGGVRSIPWVVCAALIVGELFWAAGSILTKRVALPPSSAITAGGQMIVGGVLLLVAASVLGEWPVTTRPTVGGLVAVAYMIVAGSIVAYSSYIWLLGRTSATRLASYTYVNPVVALVIGYFFAAERLTEHAFIGSLLVLLSVALVLWATRRDGVAAERVTSRRGRDLTPAPASARAT